MRGGRGDQYGGWHWGWGAHGQPGTGAAWQGGVASGASQGSGVGYNGWGSHGGQHGQGHGGHGGRGGGWGAGSGGRGAHRHQSGSKQRYCSVSFCIFISSKKHFCYYTYFYLFIFISIFIFSKTSM